MEDVASTTARPAVVRLVVTDFRNHPSTRLDIPRRPRFVLLTGPNGAGKTNLLEAVSLLAPGRGLRRAAFADMARRGGAGGWAVATHVEGMQGPVRIGMVFAATSGETGRRLRIDERPARSSGVLGAHVRIGWLTPAMDRLFTGAAGDRRRFMDRMAAALDPAHAARVAALERLVRQRNRLLEDVAGNARWLDAIEASLAERAVAVAAARLDLLAALQAGMTLVKSGDFPFPAADLRLEGWIGERLAAMPAVTAEDAYRRALAEGRARDAAAGRTLLGPHRDDLVVTHAEKDMPARLCSTGEQKALLLSIVLAHAAAVRETAGGFPPLLLLDEVAAHLDARRREGLFTVLRGLGGQVWMTGTDAALFASLGKEAVTFHVEDGRARPLA